MSNDTPNADPSSSKPPSVIGNLANLKDGEIVLPQFFIKRSDGLFVDLSKLDSSASFQMAVDRAFSANTYFTGLNYGFFSKLLYDFDPKDTLALKAASDSSSLLRFALDIAAFHDERRSLYKTVKITNGEAEYYFEAVYLENISEEPIYENGEIVRMAKKSTLEPASLTFDEFVADMWSKGVHFGIDADTVRAAIKSGKTGRVIIARRREAVLGKAADIQELADEIHRDDAPKILPDGRVDLTQFKNRFPQIKQGSRLIKKIPMVLGTPGFELSGAIIEPPIPKDLNLAALAGPGTAIVIDRFGECIVAQQDGFLNLDPQTSQISLIEKIISREGVSASTTGDLILTGDEFEGHGEVQENRLLEGNHITIHANVYGTVSSRGGNILLKRNLVGGMATNQDGNITVEGIASNAVVQTKKGEITLKRAENCAIVGTRVNIEMASNCEILADEATITEAEGCAVVAKTLNIGKAGPRKQSEMLVFVLVPDSDKTDQKLAGLKTKIDEFELTIKAKVQESEKITSQPEVKNYLVIGTKLKKNEITLSPEQMANFQKLTALVGPTLKTLNKVRAEFTALQTAQSSLVAQAATLKEEKKEAGIGISCAIAEVTGETVVRTMKFSQDGDSLYNLPPKNLKAKLRSSAATGERLFTGRSGSLNWKPPVTD